MLVPIIIVSRDIKLQYEYISLGLGVVFKHGRGMYCQVLCLQHGLIVDVNGEVPLD